MQASRKGAASGRLSLTTSSERDESARIHHRPGRQLSAVSPDVPYYNAEKKSTQVEGSEMRCFTCS
jgi:hypothetical protein